MFNSLLNRIVLALFFSLSSINLYAQFTQITTDPTRDYIAKWSPDGTTITFASQRGGKNGMWLIPVTGGLTTPLEINLTGGYHMTWSPSGEKLAFDADDFNSSEIWTISVVDSTLDQITHCYGFHPAWSPDGSMIAFTSPKSGNLDIWIISATGEGTPVQITNSPADDWHACWSPDGSQIAVGSDRNGNMDIWVIPVAGGDAVQLTAFNGYDDVPCWSPDGSQIMFYSDRSGNNDIWVIPATGGTATQLTFNPADDYYSSYSPDGSHIVFTSNRSGNMDIWIKDITNTHIDYPVQTIPKEYHLSQNYPNPFNPTTTIEFTLSYSDFVTLKIFNVLGEEIETLAAEKLSSGTHQYNWNAGGRASGVYFYRLEAGDFSQTKKLLLLR